MLFLATISEQSHQCFDYNMLRVFASTTVISVVYENNSLYCTIKPWAGESFPLIPCVAATTSIANFSYIINWLAWEGAWPENKPRPHAWKSVYLRDRLRLVWRRTLKAKFSYRTSGWFWKLSGHYRIQIWLTAEFILGRGQKNGWN